MSAPDAVCGESEPGRRPLPTGSGPPQEAPPSPPLPSSKPSPPLYPWPQHFPEANQGVGAALAQCSEPDHTMAHTSQRCAPRLQLMACGHQLEFIVQPSECHQSSRNSGSVSEVKHFGDSYSHQSWYVHRPIRSWTNSTYRARFRAENLCGKHAVIQVTGCGGAPSSS